MGSNFEIATCRVQCTRKKCTVSTAGSTGPFEIRSDHQHNYEFTCGFDATCALSFSLLLHIVTPRGTATAPA